MKSVGLQQLETHLRRYVQDVRDGQTILVTDRGEVVAELHPPAKPATDEDWPVALVEMALQGHVRLARRRGAHTYRRLARIAPDGTAGGLLEADRADR